MAVAWFAMFWPAGRHGYGPPAATDLGLVMTSDDRRLWSLSEGKNASHRVISYWFNQVSGHALMIPTADFEARKFNMQTLPRHLRPDSIDDLHMLAWYREVGWPMKALTCSIHWKTQVRNADIIYSVRGGVQLPRDREFQPRALPLTPLWGGMAASSLLYAAMWFVLLASAARWRTAQRWRRGRCLRCGYPRTGLREGSLCPECGQ